MRKFISRHRTFSEASWVLSEPILEQLENLLPRLEPDDPIKRHRWLFDQWLPSLPASEKAIDMRQAQADELRQTAVRDILNRDGIDGLVRLGTTCNYPAIVASIVVPLVADVDSTYALVEKSIPMGEKGLTFASCVSGRARAVYGDTWSERVNELASAQALSPSTITSLLLLWPDDRSTWEAAMSFGVEDSYWLQKPIRLLADVLEERLYEVNRLIEVGRAAELLSRVQYQVEKIPTQVLVQLFDRALDEMARVQTTQDVQKLALHSYDLAQFLDELRKRTDLSRPELARREYRVLPLLGPAGLTGLVLHQIMVEDSDFYVEVLCDIYLSESRDKSQDTEATQETLARARAGNLLLEGMTQLPGQNEITQIDEEILMTWVSTCARMLLERTGQVRLILGSVNCSLTLQPIPKTVGGLTERCVT